MTDNQSYRNTYENQEDEDDLDEGGGQSDDDQQPDYAEYLIRAREEKAVLAAENERLCRLASLLTTNNKNKQGTEDRKDIIDNPLEQQQYENTLQSLEDLWAAIHATQAEKDERLATLLEEKEKKENTCSELEQAFRNFKREVALEAKYISSERKIGKPELLTKESAEEKIDRRVQKVRVDHIMLTNQLKQLDDQLKKKEEVEGGYHLIDFEQLRTEHQSLQERIEERNDHLHKLRKKITTNVQVLTHIKEKLHFVKNNKTQLEQDHSSKEQDVIRFREELNRAKKLRETLRQENSLLKQKQGFIGSDSLVADYEQRKGELLRIRQTVNDLKARHQRLSDVIMQAKHAQDALAQQHQGRTRRLGIQSASTTGSSPRR